MPDQTYTEAGTTFKRRRRQIIIHAYTAGATTKPEQYTRGKIEGWNEGMSRRAGAYVENFREDFRVFGTLTYPNQFPTSGKAVKAHWRAFIERMRRSGWLEHGSIFWWLEFQERGAPHFHYLATEWIGKYWVANAWAEITGGNAAACSRVESIREPHKIGNYVRKYIEKAEQKLLPEGFVDVGRMWGCSGPRVHHGKTRLPVVVASTPRACPQVYEKILQLAQWRYQVRIAKTMNGYVVYGTEKQVEDTWHYLAENIVAIALVERSLADLRRAIAAGLRSTPDKPERTAATF